jgi:hypothetical protein
MTLAETLLPRLAEWRPAPTAGRHTFTHTDPESGWTVTIAADRQDAIGCVSWEVGVTPTTAADPATLAARAARVAGRVTGLLEPLRLLEVDAGRGEALLRSESPARRGEALHYYEVVMAARGDATLRRYEARRDAGGRTQVPFALTHEVVAKLAGDLAAD